MHASLPSGVAAPHTALTVQYLRAALPGTMLVCTAHCRRAGRRVAAAEAEIVQGGKVIAHAITSHTVLSPLA